MESIVRKNLVSQFSDFLIGSDLSLNVVFVGRTGVGKTSTINSLLSTNVAKTDRFQPATKEIMAYEHDFNRINFTINDTPGFCDDVPEKNNDSKYAGLIKSKFKIPFCLVFVTELNASRVTGDEKRTIQIITQNLGANVWERSVVIFTHSDKESQDEYQKTLETRKKLINEEISKHIGQENSAKIPYVAISNIQEQRPDGKTWKPDFYTSVLNRLIVQPSLYHLKNTYRA